MVKLDKIYTRSGDKGKTRLSTGEPVDKWNPRVIAYGTVDETNAALGVAALHADEEMLAAIRRVQNDLFDLGADLATPDRGKTLEWTPLRIIETQVKRLEAEIDVMNESLAPLDSFILPGGSALAAQMHVARTLCRRAEREVAKLAADEAEIISPEALAYINRLSDWLFVAGRVANNNGADDVKWVPGANR
ncbi:cob(I)yrinic acid a,c-diamide adenosyltransferase [Hyphomonas pacifica]|mgnify:CR=1 FL=1|uniref:Corrinoid adenosyltransferase n=1 Tax=Hyphomonas pacifica TaxID=1280941 RepID=A0A062TW87_9PROT|nr:cob(I)yrinic acid a,c-diamide adenosyltransferase [Hyphomonas pacifica]KCZ50302.1 cob(I)yrinic acid a,c-diamide adenosyltransferase [Hyphomonas pacifica]MBR9808645.1 cob(I)yrinic acid a,c-diamide adenosyltransferase [Alphaproteobacteria bacterium]RAN32779.1 cob(I)yrinic acid a,c-diamide adenosyltransferase [Hyphomonas pacifica]RAN34176.1 cob(I)yrinic acid a,c-diamide adenosyltransferase [Hyphomonas pacifica]